MPHFYACTTSNNYTHPLQGAARWRSVASPFIDWGVGPAPNTVSSDMTAASSRLHLETICLQVC